MATQAVTRTERVFSALRGDILGGVFAPGQRLPFADLRERYSCSAGVAREALLRLSEQGLALAEPQQGFRVTEVSVTDLADLTEARIEIETLVLSLAIKADGVAWESQVLAAHHRLERTPQQDPSHAKRFSEEWAAAHAAFHDSLLAACPNVRLRSIAGSLRDSAELYRRWSLPIGHDDDRDVAGEHKALLGAALEGNWRRASGVLTEHIRRTTRVLLDLVASESPVGLDQERAR
jgi:DNA-binding GntR family transcriptional regulator